jgi:hypothetical protein
MANELARRAGGQIAKSGPSAMKKHAKKAGKKAAKKAPAKKHAKKAAKHAGEPGSHDRLELGTAPSRELGRAFHHLQRASAVISLLEGESGGDLKVLLHYGVDRYREASAGRKLRKGQVALAMGILRAAEHLAMAGLYAARGVQQLNVNHPPEEEHLARQAAEIAARAANTDPGRDYGLRLRAMVYELLKRADGAEDDSHLAWELVMAADALTAALEAGVE